MLKTWPGRRAAVRFPFLLWMLVSAALVACAAQDHPNPGRVADGLMPTIHAVAPATIAPAETEKVPGSEAELREAIALRISALWSAGDFGSLEAMAEQYARTHARTYSGKWRLSLFYMDLSDQLTIPWPSEWYGTDAISCQCKVPDVTHYDEAERRWNDMQAKLHGWMERSPDSLHARLAMANLLLNRAWFYRGNGFADTVPDEAWPLFSRYVEQARMLLSQDRTQAASDPEWFGVMFRIAAAQSWSSANVASLLRDLSLSETLYIGAYDGAAMVLKPQWGGSYEQLERFARQIAAERKHEGPELYARMYWNIGANELPNTHADWSLLKQGFEDMIQRYPDPRNLNALAMFACVAGDAETFRKTVETLGDNLTPNSWTVSPELCRAHYRLGGAHTEAGAAR